jgi:hypothetical protein
MVVAVSGNQTKKLVVGSGFGVISDMDIGPDGYLYVVL